MKIDMNSGIYKITNLINNKIYIGSTKNLYQRRIDHFYSLKINKHHNSHLQNSYNKYGTENFVFEILITCHPDMLLWYEQQFSDQWKPEYNKKRIAERNATKRHSTYKGKKRGRKPSSLVTNETKEKIKKLGRMMGHSVSQNTRDKLSAKLKGRPNYNLAKIVDGLISPDGTVYKNILNLSDFCKEHGLSKGNMWSVVNRKRNHHKGWKALQGI